MPSAVSMLPGAALHCLMVEAEPDPNVLLRLLEPFVIHDVLPVRTESRADGERLRLAVVFRAAPDLAERLKMRLSVLPVVRGVTLEPAADTQHGAVSAAA